MRVLVVSQHFWPETFRINEIAQSLAAAGCEVRVLTGKPNYPDGRLFPGYRAGGTLTEMMGAIPVHRVPLIARGRGGGLRLAANYLSFLAAAAISGPGLLGGWRPDIVFTYGTSPILQAIASIHIARRTGAKAVTWVQDLWPESLSATGFVTNRAVLGAVGRVVRWIYARSDLVLVQSEAFLAPVRRLAGATPVAVHPNPGELAFGRPPPPGPPALTLRAGFPIVFAGNFGTVQALPTILDAAALLADTPDIGLVLVGSGGQGAWLAAEVARRGLGNVDLPGRFEPDAMPGILHQAGALLVTLARQPILALTVPSKVQAYLAAGKPIVAAIDGEGARVIAAAGAGLVAPAEDAAALAAAARALYRASVAERAAMGAAGRDYYARHYDPAVLTPALVAHFERALGTRR